MAEISAPAVGTPHHSVGRYVGIWAALLVLTASTFLASRVDLGAWNHFIAMAIAVAKAGLVLMFFMHLSEHKGAVRLIFATAVIFVLLLIGLTVGDVATRFPLANPPSGESVHAPGIPPRPDADPTTAQGLSPKRP